MWTIHSCCCRFCGAQTHTHTYITFIWLSSVFNRTIFQKKSSVFCFIFCVFFWYIFVIDLLWKRSYSIKFAKSSECLWYRMLLNLFCRFKKSWLIIRTANLKTIHRLLVLSTWQIIVILEDHVFVMLHSLCQRTSQ